MAVNIADLLFGWEIQVWKQIQWSDSFITERRFWIFTILIPNNWKRIIIIIVIIIVIIIIFIASLSYV